MFFDSTVYLVFLVLVTVLYWRLRFRAQNCFLLAASYFFYGWWDWRFLLLMGASTVIDYFIARGIASSENPSRRRTLLILSLVLNFGFLGFFKYFNFFAGSLGATLSLVGMSQPSIRFLQILLPPGISF